MNIEELLVRVEETLLGRFKQAGFVEHAGDRGENREQILRDFLTKHLPRRYGVTKGEIVTQHGQRSHAVDVIIYDADACPVLYVEQTAVVPIEGVYGIIEVKSTLSKRELVDALRKIESFKKLAPRELSVIQTRQYVTVHRPSRPFGIVLGYRLTKNSLDSLAGNWRSENERIHDVNFFANLVVVLGHGLLRYESANLTRGEKAPLLDTDDFVNLIQTREKRTANNEPMDEIVTRLIKEDVQARTFGRFFVYLLIILSKLRLGVPDLGRYVDPDLPLMITRES